MDHLNEGKIISYIMNEAEAVKAEMENHLKEIQKEEKVMQELLDDLNEQANALDNKAVAARERQEKANAIIEQE